MIRQEDQTKSSDSLRLPVSYAASSPINQRTSRPFPHSGRPIAKAPLIASECAQSPQLRSFCDELHQFPAIFSQSVINGDCSIDASSQSTVSSAPDCAYGPSTCMSPTAQPFSVSPSSRPRCLLRISSSENFRKCSSSKPCILNFALHLFPASPPSTTVSNSAATLLSRTAC